MPGCPSVNPTLPHANGATLDKVIMPSPVSSSVRSAILKVLLGIK